jgi:carboxylesterase type B
MPVHTIGSLFYSGFLAYCPFLFLGGKGADWFQGSLKIGTGSLLIYNGSSFAAFQDVVVVTFNYRTNIFGFSNSPEIAPGQQNSGFLDQRLALQWVQSNIASFGGDPSRVTIFGESAGAESVKQLLAQPPSPLPFHAAIIQSTGTDISRPPSTSYEQVVAHFNCTATAAASQLTCLRNVLAADIKTYISQNSIDFNPVPDQTFTEDINPYITTHKLADVPILIGSNANEGSILLPSLGLGNTTLPAAAILSLLLPSVNTSTIAAILTSPFYTGLQNDTFALIAQVATDLVITCPTSSVANLLAANGYEVWRYYYKASFPNTNYFPNAGAYHSSEIPQVFGTYPLASATTDQEGLSKFTQSAWAAFAERGPGWPALGSAVGDVLGVLGGEGDRTGVQVVEAGEVDGVCVLLDPIIGLGGL